MANYYATARSNYFAVKDEQAFREWADGLGLTILEPSEVSEDLIDRFGISPGDDDDGGGWPTSMADDETGDCEDIDVADQLAAHLADNEVAILMEAGSEKLRYIIGWADAVNNKGEHVILALDSIYTAARKLGPNITRAEY